MKLLTFSILAFQPVVFSFFFDSASNGKAIPVWRRIIRDDLSHIYRYKSPVYDSSTQRRAGTYTNPSMYYDPGWSDWNQNTLTTNMLDGSYLRQGEAMSISAVQNPIMAPDGDDIFLKTFRRVPPPDTNEPPAILKTKFFTIKHDGTLKFLD